MKVGKNSGGTHDRREIRREETEIETNQQAKTPHNESFERNILTPFSFDGGEFETPLCSVGEDHAKAHDESAAWHEREGRATLAKEQREIAAWWRKLVSLPANEAEPVRSDLHMKGTDAIDALFVLVENSDAPLLELALLANHILDSLLSLAARGHEKAAGAFMLAIGEAVNNFEFLAHRKPKLFRESARRSIAIPGLISRNKAQARDNKHLLEALQQGEDCHLAILPTGKRSWDFNGPNLIAVGLVTHIQSSNRFYESDRQLTKGGGPKLPVWRAHAAKLSPFSANSWDSWANVAWEIVLDATSGRPEEEKALRPFGESAGKKMPKYCKELHPPTIASNIRAKIKSRLRTAFKTIAGEAESSPGN